MVINNLDPFSGLLSFVNVAEARSFTAAAHRLGISPSAVSKAVSKLETEMGVRLFVRTSRRVTLTEEGYLFFERCRRILGDLEDARQQLARAQTEPQGTLRITCSPSFCLRVVMPLIPVFLRQYPGLRVDLDLSTHRLDLVEAGFDLGIRIGEIPDARLVAKELCRLRWVTAASPVYLAQAGTPRRPQELYQHNCLAMINASTGATLDWTFTQEGGEMKIHPQGTLQSENSAALASAAVSGVGIVQALDYMVQAELDSGQLVSLLEPFATVAPQAFLLYPENRRLTPKVRVFVDFMVEQLRSGAP